MATLEPGSDSGWLRAFCSEASFFGPCPKCSTTHSQRDATCNFYCKETAQELCSVCAHEHSGTIIQVRRSSYHDVVRAQDIAKLADVAGVQSYTINGARVLFLRRRPQPRPPKGVVGASQCTICSRHLQDISLYCSLQCKLDSLSCGTPACLHSLSAGSDCDSGSHAGPDTPSHLAALHAVDSSCSDSESMDCCNREQQVVLFFHRKRKGSPLRSPMD